MTGKPQCLMMARQYRGASALEKDFINKFRSLCNTNSTWQVWADFVEMAAIAIANRVDQSQYEDREARYLQIVKRYNQKQQAAFPAMLALTVEALEENPDQDFLGSLYMQLELGNHWKGQFFTPFHICHAMARITAGDLDAAVKEKGWIGVSDPCCGAGAMFVAFASECRRQKVNYQQRVLYIGQDLDPVVAYMCYIQISLLGCAGYVKIGNSLTEPMTGDPLLPQPGPSLWITPMFCSDVWHWRRVWHSVDRIIQTEGTSVTAGEEPEPQIEEPAVSARPPQQLSMF